MIFPEKERVHYQKTPLKNVVCQLRFPTILDIDSTIPAKFQDKIRAEFPIYKKSDSITKTVKINMTSPQISSAINKRYGFFSEDKKTKIFLASNYMSMETEEYKCWENFWENLQLPLAALNNIYNPAFYTRIGIRYIDIFSKKELGIFGEESWKELINPSFLGLIGDDKMEKFIKGENATYDLYDEESNTKMHISTGVIYQRLDNEQCILLDTDIYTDIKTNISQLEERIKGFHKEANDIMRYFVTEKMEKIMEPGKYGK